MSRQGQNRAVVATQMAQQATLQQQQALQKQAQLQAQQQQQKI